MTTNPAVNKPLSDKRVRQAVRYAVDYNGIIKGLLNGVGTQPISMIPNGLLGADAATVKKLRPKRNLSRARTLMRQAGYAGGFDVTMSYAGGVTFDGVSYDLIAPKIQHDLADIGIKVKLDPQQNSVLLAAYRAQKLPFILYNWGVDYPDSNDFAGPFSPGGGPAKRMWYIKNDRLQGLVKRADSVADTKKRASLYRQVESTWLNESPWVGLVQPKGILVLHRGVAGYAWSPQYQNDFRNIRKS